MVDYREVYKENFDTHILACHSLTYNILQFDGNFYYPLHNILCNFLQFHIHNVLFYQVVQLHKFVPVDKLCFYTNKCLGHVHIHHNSSDKYQFHFCKYTF